MAEALTIKNSARQITEAIKTLPTEPDDPKEGRGIVIAAGGTRLSINAWVNLRLLRDHGCQLPIEMWYLGDKEFSQGYANLVEPYDVTLVNAHDYLDKHPHGQLRGWELKPYAIAHSRFAEVMFLDADNTTTRDPTYLLDDARYREVGTMFWPDFGRLEPEREAWEVFGVKYRDEPEVESGQSLINKLHPGNWRCLMLCNWLMQNSANFFFGFVHGDKEIFHMAWRRLDQPYVMPDRGIDALPGVMCQHDLDGRRIFQHRNMRKWQFGHNERTPGFVHEDRCLELVDELRRKWSPCTAEPPSAEDLKVIESLDGKRFVYIRLYHDHREIGLKSDGSFVNGGESRERYWTIRHEGGIATMTVIGDDGQLTMQMTRKTVGQAEIWSGAWLVHERMPVMLVPLSK